MTDKKEENKDKQEPDKPWRQVELEERIVDLTRDNMRGRLTDLPHWAE